MKCNKCGYDLKIEDGYCPNCGTEINKQHKVQCCHCHYEMDEESNFCPGCGKKVIKDKNSCKYCGYSLGNEELFCPSCGKETESNVLKVEVPREEKLVEQTDSDIEEPRGYSPIGKTTSSYVKEKPKVYTTGSENPVETKAIVKKDGTSIWRNPILWIISIALLIICILLSQYMKENPSNIRKTPNTEQKVVEEELDDIKIAKDTSVFTMQTNNNVGGTSYQFKDKLYLSVDGSIYQMNLDFSEAKKVVDEAGEYIYVDDKYIYYCDTDYNYQRVDLKTDKKETLLENIYYVRMIEGMLYYQSDSDGESIHVYNLEIKEDRKINNEKSYAMIVDTKNNVIYYTNAAGVLSKVNIDGTASEVILDASVLSFVYEEGSIYYTSATGIGKVDLATKENTTLLEKADIDYISLLEDKIVYGGHDVGLYTINKDGTSKKTITTNYIYGVEVQGDVVIYTDASKGAIYGATKDAKRARIHEIKYEDSYQDDSLNIDGIQEF